jgi:hypothetical protein
MKLLTMMHMAGTAMASISHFITVLSTRKWFLISLMIILSFNIKDTATTASAGDNWVKETE